VISRLKPMINISFAWKVHPPCCLSDDGSAPIPDLPGLTWEKRLSANFTVDDRHNPYTNKIYTANATETPRRATAALPGGKLCAANFASGRDKVEERSTIPAPPSLMVTGRHRDTQ
jgi:hypothetical protein